jgi:hypothetical protein
LNEDFRDCLQALVATGARFLVVGAHAMAVHGVPRATGDLDIWIDRDSANARKVWQALVAFGAPLAATGITESDFAAPGTIVQIGLPPRRIDLLTEISGVEFGSAWRSRVCHDLGGLSVPFLGREDLLRNKAASGRLKDKADLEALGGPEP